MIPYPYIKTISNKEILEFYKKHQAPIIFLFFFAIMIILKVISEHQLKKNGVYSIATVKEVKRAKNGFSVKIVYIYKSETIVRNHTSRDVDWSMIDKRLYVQFLPNEPKGDCRLICCNSVPDSIQNVPYEGWKVPPTYFKDINE